MTSSQVFNACNPAELRSRGLGFLTVPFAFRHTRLSILMDTLASGTPLLSKNAQHRQAVSHWKSSWYCHLKALRIVSENILKVGLLHSIFGKYRLVISLSAKEISFEFQHFEAQVLWNSHQVYKVFKTLNVFVGELWAKWYGYADTWFPCLWAPWENPERLPIVVTFENRPRSKKTEKDEPTHTGHANSLSQIKFFSFR